MLNEDGVLCRCDSQLVGLRQRSEDSMWWKVCWDVTKGGKEMFQKEKRSEFSETKRTPEGAPSTPLGGPE